MNINTLLTEGLDFQDMVGQVEPIVTVDEYSAKMGKDSDIVTLSFKVNSEAAGNDLVDWFERGYEWVLDASLSEGEVEVGKYLVFVEMNRRSSVPSRIIELLKDLKTLTNMKLTEWVVEIDGTKYEAKEQNIKENLILNPNEYKAANEDEEELNEMRLRAGMDAKAMYSAEKDSDIKDFLAKAGL